jgi:hypothetical protein
MSQLDDALVALEDIMSSESAEGHGNSYVAQVARGAIRHARAGQTDRDKLLARLDAENFAPAIRERVIALVREVL